MKRALFAGLLVLTLIVSPQPAQSAPTAAAPPTLAYTGTMARHPDSVKTGLSGPTSVTVHRGDTYGRWALTYCGTFAAWPAIAAANVWPERRIPVGATAKIVCPGSVSATPPAPASSAAWVHPLASGKHGNSCYRTPARPNHGGVDMAQPSGTVIRAASAGTVYLKRFQRGGAGYYLVLRHPGNEYTLYMHMIRPSSLAIGAHVWAGQAIGNVGATGNATGPHLHFEVHQGGASSSYRINPAVFMRAHGINIGC